VDRLEADTHIAGKSPEDGRGRGQPAAAVKRRAGRHTPGARWRPQAYASVVCGSRQNSQASATHTATVASRPTIAGATAKAGKC